MARSNKRERQCSLDAYGWMSKLPSPKASASFPIKKPESVILASSSEARLLQHPLKLDKFHEPEMTESTLEPSIHVLAPGVVLFKHFLSMDKQVKLLDCVCDIHSIAPMFIPSFSIGSKTCFYDAYMTSTGHHWNGTARKFTSSRSDFDDLPVPPTPTLLQQLFWDVVNHPSTVKAGLPIPKSSDPDMICLVNYYAPKWGKKGRHRDSSESKETLKHGVPVVSASIGDDCTFVLDVPETIDSFEPGTSLEGTGMYAQEHPCTRQLRIDLSSGDVLVFGGPARLAPHAVLGTVASKTFLPMIPGRVNFTMRAM